MLRQRLISGISIALGIIGLLVLDAWIAAREPLALTIGQLHVGYWLSNGAICTLVVLVLTVLLTRELIGLAQALGARPLRFEAQLFAIGLVVGPYISFNLAETASLHDESWGGLWLAIALGYAFWMQAVRRGTQNVMINLSSTMLIIFYAGGLAGYLTKLRMEVGGHEGTVLLLFSMVVVKMTDVGAYFTGLVLGRTKMIPWLSPKKTWEGLVGGVIIAVGCAVGLGKWLASANLVGTHEGVFAGVGALIVFGIVMAVFSIAGDLAGSLLKRDAAVKDSSRLIPGMGGMLDILDSPLLAAPAAWFFWTRLAPIAF